MRAIFRDASPLRMVKINITCTKNPLDEKYPYPRLNHGTMNYVLGNCQDIDTVGRLLGGY